MGANKISMNSLNKIQVNSTGLLDAFLDTGYTESPEWIRVITDNQDRILGGIKPDGSIEWAIGVPTPVKDYLNTEISKVLNGTESTSIDGLNKIITFLEDFSTSDTLVDLLSNKADASLLDNKVDKELGKSLIDENYASSQSTNNAGVEYLQVTTDSENKIIEGIKADGTKTFHGDVEVLGLMQIDGTTYKVINNSEFIAAWIDNNNKIIFGFKNDGKTFIGDADFLNELEELKNELPVNINWEALTVFNECDNSEFISLEMDNTEKIISYRDINGVLNENVGINSSFVNTNSLQLTQEGMTEFQQALKDSGFNPGGTGDWTDSKSIEIPIPRCAIANITNDYGTATWPTAKGVDLKYYLEFWDMQGNYFKKEIIFNALGNSSMAFIKKNGAADFCNNNGWDDDDTFSIKFGDWVALDSFHFKAYYTDYIKGSCIVAYQISEAVYKTRGIYADVPWKKALIDFSKIIPTNPAGLSADGISDVSLQIDNGARCMPDGFPCIFYLNGLFYGIYSWQIKKHRDNYHFEKSNPKHIHLDGTLNQSSLWNSSVNWTAFEIRNPKSLVYATAHNDSYKYDADIAQDEIAGNSDGSLTYDDWVAGSYLADKIVKHRSHYYINTISDNTAEPIYDKKNNGDDAPDFKNKTGCGWINCTNTIKVKESIINLSKRVSEINTLNSTDSAAAKVLFDTYFDADNLIDYQLINMAVNDPDGYSKNWQWITYDGVKWYVCQYDKDMSFGNHWTGMFTRYTSAGWGASDTSLPTGLALRYYYNEHISRWKELVNLGIFTADFFKNKINEWVTRIGLNNLKNEWKKWSEAPCNRDSLIDFENWRFTGGYAYGTPNGDIWNNETSYNANQTVWFQCENTTEYLLFRAQLNNVGKPCLTGVYTTYPTAMGYRDSVWRYFKYIEANLTAQNNFINSL